MPPRGSARCPARRERVCLLWSPGAQAEKFTIVQAVVFIHPQAAVLTPAEMLIHSQRAGVHAREMFIHSHRTLG